MRTTMWCMVMWMVVSLAAVAGCSQRDDQLAAVRDILALAKEDKVRGKMRLTLNGEVEAGLKEGVYFGSPGSRLDADLSFKVENIGGEEAQ